MKIQRFVLQIFESRVIGHSNGDSLESDFVLAGKRLSTVRSLADQLKEHEQALSKDKLAKLGDMLFEALLTGPILDRFRELYKTVAEEDGILRLELIFSDKAQAAAGLPWEFLRVSAKYQIPGLEPHLAVSGKVTVVRNVFNLKARKLRRVGSAEKLRVGVAVSQPKIWDKFSRELGPIDPQPVLEMLDELQGAATPLFSIDYKKAIASKSAIRELLQSYEPFVLHFIGHGDIDKPPKGAFLVLIDDQTKNWEDFYSAIAVTAPDLCKLIDNQTLPTVVILQACNTAVGGLPAAYSNTAAELARAGVPLVVAFQYEMQNNTASEFGRRLYQALAAGQSVESSVNTARRYLFDLAIDRGFGTPVVFVTNPESQLFSRSAEQAEQDQLAEELLALPNLDKVEGSLIADIYQACIEQKITLIDPIAGAQGNIRRWILHLAHAIPAPGKSGALAYFAATLGDRVLVSHRPLADALWDWLKDHAQELGIDLDNLNALILRDPKEIDPPYLQVILTTYANTEHFTITTRDGRSKKVLASEENIPWKELAGKILSSVRKMSMNSEEVARKGDLLSIEFFLPTSLLSKEVEQLSFQDEDEEEKLVLGHLYKVVVCSGYRLKNRWKPALESAWSKKWIACHDALMNSPTILTQRVITNSNLSRILEAMNEAHVVGLTFEPRDTPPAGKLLTTFLKSGVPVAVWVRAGANTQAAEKWLNEQITLKLNLPHLSELIREERKTDSPLRNDLVLLWDNFDHDPGLPDSFSIA